MTDTEATQPDDIRLRGDSMARWVELNPVIPARQPVIDTDTGKIRIGDGVTRFLDLPDPTADAIRLALEAASRAEEAADALPGQISDALRAAGIDSANLVIQIDKDTRRISTSGVVAALGDELTARFAIVLPSPGSTVDVGPIIQALYRAKVTHITMRPQDVYYINSTIYRDSADVRNTLAIDWNEAPLFCGPNAGAKASDYDGDPATRFLVFGNTRESAYTAATNTVTTTEDTTATGRFTATVGVGVRMTGMDVRGNNQPIRAVHGSNTSVHLEGRTTNMLGALGCRQYSDSNYVRVRNTNPYTGSTIEQPSSIKQYGNGDNLVLIGNADSRSLVADLRYCRGATLLAPVGGGMRFVDCFAINVLGGHIEGDEHLRAAPALTVTRSQVRIVGTEFWSSNTVRDNGLPAIQTIDVRDGSSSPDAFTELTLEGVISRAVYRIASDGGSIRDEAQMPDLTLTSMNVNSRIRARGYTATVGASDELTLTRVAPLVASPVAAIQAALTAGAAIIATGFWDLLQLGGTWRVVPAMRPDLVGVVARQAAPTPADPIRSTSIPGALPGGTYNYYFAEIDEAGVFSKRTLAKQIVQPAALATVRLDVTLRRPGRLAVWRQNEGSAVDRYAVIGTDSTKLFLYDTGSNLSKRPWQTTGIPERPGTDTSTSVDSLSWNGRGVTLA